MKILLLGGTGFVGHYLYQQLSNDHSVDLTYCGSVVKTGIQYNIKTQSLNSIINKEYDLVINNVNPTNLTYTELVKSVEELANWCRETGTWLIHNSSISATSANKYLNSYNLKKSISEDILRQEIGLEGCTILRFTQLFDPNGLAMTSQRGLYYLLEAIKYQKTISLLSNYREIFRNYMPIELAMQIYAQIIETNYKGIVNAYLNEYTLPFDEIVNKLTGMNPCIKHLKLITVGAISGINYILEPPSIEVETMLKDHYPIEFYFREAYLKL